MQIKGYGVSHSIGYKSDFSCTGNGMENRMQVQPEECIMVVNDVGDDMVAEKLGMKVFLLTDCLINKEQKNISAFFKRQ